MCALLVVACSVSAAAEDPRNDFLDRITAPSSITSMTLSPDGKHLAAIGGNGFGNGVILTDADTLEARMLVKPEHISLIWIYTRVPIDVHWIASDLLAVDFNDEESEAIDLSGKKVAKLGQRFIRNMKVDAAGDGPWVLAYRDIEDREIDLVHARTGERRKFKIALPGKLVSSAFDAHGALRAVQMMDTSFWTETTKVTNWYRAGEQAPWQKLAEASVTERLWTPLFVPDEPDTLVVSSDHERDTQAIFRYDTRTGRHVELMAGHPKEDILGASGLNAPVFKSVVTEGLKPQVYWFDARWAALQRAVDAALPGHINLLSGDPSGRVLVFSVADIDPGRWYLLDTASFKMREVAQAQPEVDPSEMRPMETFEYPAGDGFMIPAYLTKPNGEGKKLPMVVLIHGGPNVRDSWEWNDEVQLLAANGYAVFQPQFRGSSGFGRRFEEAGYGQWGLAMQDDITAGVKYLIDQGIADPGRICIYGASYGGYAALWGVVKTPELYRCAITLAGVTDIEYMLKDWSDDSNAAVRELRRARIGDLKRDRERFAQVSPLKQADRIRVPLLIAHGDKDLRVPIAHSEKLIAVLKEHRKAYEWLLLKGEGHGFVHLEPQRRYYRAMLNFLDKHIGAAATHGQ